MIDLLLSSGLPIKFNEINEKFLFADNIVFNSLNRIPLKSLLPTLLNKSIRYPETVYIEHKNIRRKEDADFFKQRGYNYDLLLIPSGLMGVEFIRTHIFHSASDPDKPSISEIIEVHHGNLVILLQKNQPKAEMDFDTRVSEGLVVRLKAGEKFALPQSYYYTFINTKSYPVIFSRFYKENTVCDYTQLRREQGLAYFAIRKNAKQEIVLNPRYREIPQIRVVSPEEVKISSTPDLSDEKPLYDEVVERSDELCSCLY
jgi:oxalate decarboxylase/phosphoglucose isomerase-like protein (cupin superfamily)